jgi:hypothetical protein
MSVTEYRTINKSAWQPGPWSDEPDKAQWYDEATGLPCLVVRGPCGALCGYVGVRPGHPWHGVEYDSVETVEEDEWGCKSPDVHGGLTFSAPCTHGADPATGICHIPAPGDTDNIWWLPRQPTLSRRAKTRSKAWREPRVARCRNARQALPSEAHRRAPARKRHPQPQSWR